MKNPSTSRRLNRRAAVCIGLLIGLVVQTASVEAAPRRPNFVFVLLDDAGFSDFGAYGSEIATPNIDQLARQGVRFANFHTASTCEASRTMLHSGVDSHLAGAGTLNVLIADNQKGRPGYEGYLNDDALSLGQLMRDGGYATYFAGKWNLGNGLERAPGARGWDRYIGLEQTGADNYEAKIYAPFNMEAVWWEDGKRAELPADFYSSRYYVDKTIGYIEEGRAADKPFFAMVAFQAVHSPLQAPDADIAKYADRYTGGWDRLREERYQRQVAMGLVPGGQTLRRSPGAALYMRDWQQMSDEDRQVAAKRMAVYAAMLDYADQQVGRLREYLARTGQLDNTVFIVMSDNGADPADLSSLNLLFRLWYRLHYALDSARAGQKGSYTHYTIDWAQVSNTPFVGFKGTALEGGMRVPLIVSWPGHIPGDRIEQQFTHVTDLLPTILDLADIARPGATYHGQAHHAPTGLSLMPVLGGAGGAVLPARVFGYESTGGAAVFKGDYKLVRDVGSYGDTDWRLFDLRRDPLESTDLAAREPAVVADMLREMDLYARANRVVFPAAGYDPLHQLLRNNWPILLRQIWPVLAGMAVVAGLVAWFGFRLLRRLWRRTRTGTA